MTKSASTTFLRRDLPSWLEVMADEPSYLVAYTDRGAVEVASSPYDTFNICHYTGDDVGHVGRCRALLAEWLDVGADRLVVPRQIHSVNVAVVGRLPVAAEEVEGADGVATVLKEVAIGVSTADCVPVILVDPVAGVVAAVHAGWRGAVGGVVRNGVRRIKELGADPARTLAYIGPSICVDCFEVGEEVAARFPEECVVRYADGRRPHVDLPGYVCRVLEEAGLRGPNIRPFEKTRCTRCHPDRYFSARSLGVGSGRNFTFVMLRTGAEARQSV